MHYTTIIGRLVGGDITTVGIALLLVDNYSESCIKMAYRAAVYVLLTVEGEVA